MLVFWSGAIKVFGSLGPAAGGVALLFGAESNAPLISADTSFTCTAVGVASSFGSWPRAIGVSGTTAAGVGDGPSSILSVFLSSLCVASFTAAASSVLAGVGSAFLCSSWTISLATFGFSSFTTTADVGVLGGVA